MPLNIPLAKQRTLSFLIYERSGEAVLEVKDFGIGIPVVTEEGISKIFTGENRKKISGINRNGTIFGKRSRRIA